MNTYIRPITMRLLLAACLASGAVAALAAQTPYEPMVGQDGKDVIWVPTPDVMVEKMLDLARVTPRDFVMDLGSGDGRNVIGAAKRGARGLGVEYNSDLVEHARSRAAAAGVSERAQFVQGDMYAADVSPASVLMLFLLPDNLRELLPTVVGMKAGSRIVSNTYEFPGWIADASETVRESCAAFCIVFLYVVPARVAGAWRMPEGELTLEQDFSRVSGAYDFNGINLPLESGRLNGADIRFTVNGIEYSGRVDGDVMQGTAKGRNGTAAWRASRVVN
jgi:SAM-dependent methyltransferase